MVLATTVPSLLDTTDAYFSRRECIHHVIQGVESDDPDVFQVLAEFIAIILMSNLCVKYTIQTNHIYKQYCASIILINNDLITFWGHFHYLNIKS